VATTREPYAYTGDNPLNATDPTGLEAYSGPCGYDPNSVECTGTPSDEYPQYGPEGQYPHIIRPDQPWCGATCSWGAITYQIPRTPAQGATALVKFGCAALADSLTAFQRWIYGHDQLTNPGKPGVFDPSGTP
jgi:hypothetical protein